GIERYNPRRALRPITLEDDRWAPKRDVAGYQKKLADLRARMKAIEDALAPRLEGGEADDFRHEQNRPDILRKHVPKHVSKETVERYLSLAHERAALERSEPPALAQALCVTERGRPTRTYVLRRGDPRSPGEEVAPGFPSVLSARPPVIPAPPRAART